MNKTTKKIILILFLPMMGLFFYVALIKAETSVDTKKEIVTIPDRDGDGLVDGEDPHPDYPEVYIVEDKNFNGIVDKFENQ